MLLLVLWGVRVWRFTSFIVANILWPSESKQTTFSSRGLSSLGLTFDKSVFGHLLDGSSIHSVAAAFDPKTFFASFWNCCIQFFYGTGQLWLVVNKRSDCHNLLVIPELPLADA